MAVIVLLNQAQQEIKFIHLTDEMSREIEDKYDNNVESWICDKGLEDNLQFRFSDCNYMYCEVMPEIFGYYAEEPDLEIPLHLFQ